MMKKRLTLRAGVCRAVKKEEYANAAKYFLLARRILGRYEHITSFKVRGDVVR